MIKTRLNVLAIFMIVVFSVFFFSLGVFLFLELKTDLVLGGVFLLILSFYTLYSGLKKYLTRIFVKGEIINVFYLFKNKQFHITDIERVRLQNSYGDSVMKLTLSNGEFVLFEEESYLDLWKVKKILERKIRPKDKKSKILKRVENIKIKGSVFNFASLFLVLIVFMFFLLLFEGNGIIGVVFSLILLGVIFLFGLFFFYFAVENQKLIIKNHMFFWYKKEYDLNEILDLKKETRQARITVDGLRVITKDYKTKYYLSVLYRSKDWSAFLKNIKK